jgi:DNA polymerase III epsilon subunit family exonuclease
MFISLDLETTGLDKRKDQITEFGAIKFDLEGNTETFQTFINPGVKIPEFITHITNITDEDVKDAPKIEDASEEIAKFIGDSPIIGHFISFDTDFLKSKGIPLKNPLYDTAELTRIFFPGLPSYSLEILTDLLGIEHKEKHRALDDAIAAQQLFVKIIQRIETLEPNLLQEIKDLGSKSTWHFAETLKEISSKPDATSQEKDIIASEPTKLPELTPPEEETLELLTKEKKTPRLLLETPIITPQLVAAIAQKAPKNTAILCSDDLFNEIPTQDTASSIAKLSKLEDYISLARLEEFKKRNSFNAPQITALIKTIIWAKDSKTGLLTEGLQFSQDEKQILQSINICPINKFADSPETQEPTITNHKKTEEESDVIIGTYAYKPAEKFTNLIVVDNQKFTQHLQFSQSRILLLKKTLEPLKNLLKLTQTQENAEEDTIKELIEKSELLFALLEKIAERNFKPNDYYPQFEVSAFELSNPNWERARETIKGLIATSQNLGAVASLTTYPILLEWKEILKDLDEIFVNTDLSKNLIVFQRSRTGDLLIRSIIRAVETDFRKHTTIIGKGINAEDDCKLTKTILALPEETKFLEVAPSEETLKATNVFLVSDIRGNPSQIFDKSVEFSKNFLRKEPGQNLLILNSIAKLEQLHLILAPKLKKEEITLLSQKGSGGLGKILEIYKSAPESSNISLSPNRWEFLASETLTPEQTFKNLVLFQIPFDPPSDPFLMALSRNFQDPWNEFQIPRAILSLKKIITKFLASAAPTGTNRSIIITDSRLIEKSYTKPFVKVLEKYSRPEETESSSLL